MGNSLELLLTTAFIAVVSALVSILLGYPIGSWLSSLGRAKTLVTSVLLVPFVLPAFVVGLAVRPLVGDLIDDARAGVAAVIAAHALMNAGFIAVVTAASLVPADQWEAAVLDGASPRQASWFIQLPQQLPALAAAGLLVALYSATSYGLIITLGQGSIQTLETEIVQAALQRLDLPAAALLAALQSALTLAFFLVSRRLGATPSVLFGELGEGRSASRSGQALGLALIVIIAVVVGGVVARAATLGSGLVGNLANLATRGSRDVLNVSVIEAIGNSLRNALVAVVIALVVAWWLSAKRVGLAVLIPIGVSPVVFGLLALVASGYAPAGLAGSWVIVPLVQSIFLTPLAFQIVAPARRAVSPEMLDAARLDGAGGWRLWGLVEIPTLARPLGAAAALVSLGAIGEFGAASMLAYGSEATLPLVMFRLISRPGPENLGMAMTAASVFILIATLVVWLVVGRWGQGNQR